MECNSLKKLLFGSLLLAAAGCLDSCSETSDVVWDIAPIVPKIYLNDADGRNLLDPAVGEGVDISGVSATFREETYYVTCGEDTKAYLPVFIGLVLKQDFKGNYCLEFGELDGTEDFSNESLAIDWGDGSSTVITIYNRFRWKNNGSPAISRHFLLDGVRTKDEVPVFYVVK